MTHTEAGTQILRNFLFDIAGCEASWDLGDFRRRKVEEIRRQVGDKHVIAAVSGGVDSSVAALLVAEAIGDQLTAIFVDNGVLRKHEAVQVVSRLSEGLGMHIVAVDGRQRFYERLAGIEEPETKRKRIGNELDSFQTREAVFTGALVLNVMLFLNFFPMPKGQSNENSRPSVVNTVAFAVDEASLGAIRAMDDIAFATLEELRKFTPAGRPSIIVSNDLAKRNWFLIHTL